ncbi:MAG: helix-turn-helix transcriptional regulator [Balneolaceae bacterium]
MASIGKDLARIRNYLGISREEIHRTTRIPVGTIRRIEDGSLLSNTEENPTYIRSFVRTFGRALKLKDELIVEALNQHEAGEYTHLLLAAYPELSSDIGKSDSSTQHESREVDETVTELPETGSSPLTAPSSTQKTEQESNTSPPSLRSVNWADMGKKFKKIERSAPLWLISLVIILIIAGISGWVLYKQNLIGFSNQSDEADVENPNGSEPPSMTLIPESEPEEPEPIPELEETLYLTVYAANGQLEPVRVWSDLKPRVDPYWMESGIAFNFEFQDTIRVRGQYSRMLLFLNGHRIESFRDAYYSPDEDAVQLVREIFEGQPHWAEPVPLELPSNVPAPDTLMNRPTF